MKKTVALLISLILALSVITPVLAYSGVSGLVVDSLTSLGWKWGGDVLVINRSTTPDTLLAMCSLDPGGNIVAPGGVPATTCLYGASFFGPIPFAPPTIGVDNIDVIIDFHCNLSGLCSGGTEGTPDPVTVSYTEQDPLGISLADLGLIPTGTGPNAVQLSGMGGASGLVVALVLAAVAGGSIVINKRLYKVSKPEYLTPEVIHEGVLETRAGSTSGDDVLDGFLAQFD